MKLQRLAAIGAATLAAIGLTLAAATPALAHDELIDKGLEVDAATGDLTAINLVFSNDIMPVGTEILVTDDTGADAASADPEISGPNVRQGLDAPLAAGTYRAVWRVVSSDGHPISGEFGFTVEENGGASNSAIIETDPRFADDPEGETGESADTSAPADAARADSSFPIGGWIALGAVLIVGLGSVAYLTSRGRKKSADASDAVDALETPGTTDERNSVN